VTIIQGDCIEVLKTLPDCSVDAVVTDPPYGLSFMGKRWDYDVPSQAVWAECLRVLKPGGHLLAFAGTRTQHRMAVRIEDAGFEIRDMIAWVYGSGFPKSLDVSKAIDKCNGEPNRLHKFTAWMRTTGLTARQLDKITDTNMGGHYLTAASQPAIPTAALWELIRPHCGDVPHWVDELVQRIESEREVVGQAIGTDTAKARLGMPGQDNQRRKYDITSPATDAARQWQGWGTALKPALEPITVARKPLDGTVAENVLAWGTGALNVDGCRVETNGERPTGSGKKSKGVWDLHAGSQYQGHGNVTPEAGRWPANLIHDGSEEVVGLFPETGPSSQRQGVRTGKAVGTFGAYSGQPDVTMGHDDAGGSAARFFYCAKASKADRDEGLQNPPQLFVQFQTGNGASGKPSSISEGRNTQYRNHHPTVKPTELMRYLVRLVTPPGGVVLDPFMGSGSTGKACALEGFAFIGIEREAEYVEIARARIAAVSPEPVASVAPARHAPAPKPAPAGQLSLFDE